MFEADVGLLIAPQDGIAKDSDELHDTAEALPKNITHIMNDNVIVTILSFILLLLNFCKKM